MADKSSSLELLEQIKKLKDAAYRDSLTGLFNRRAAEIYVESGLAQMRMGEQCMMMVIDLDNFKMVNDTLGHQTGDRVLCTAANILSALFRPGDIVARLGGDEYIIFLCGHITRELAEAKGRRICENLQLTAGDKLKVTVSSSVGIFLSNGSCTSFREMYRMADAALYHAKNSGKNRFFISQDCSVVMDSSCRDALYPSVFRKEDDERSLSYNSIAIIRSESSARVIYADAAFCGMLDMEEHEMEDQTILDYIHPDDVPVFLTILERVEEKEGISVQVRLRSLSGEWVYSRINAVLIEYDKSKCILLKLVNMLQTDEESLTEKDGAKISSEDSRHDMWEVDWATKNFRFHDRSHIFMPVEDGECSFPYGLVQNGWIAPESVTRFIKFATEIFTGRVSGYGNFLIKSEDKMDYMWATVSYRTQGDSHGVPRRILGKMVPLNIALQVERIPFARRTSIPIPAIDGMIVKFDANVTRDSITKVWVEGDFQEGDCQSTTISQFIVDEGRKIYDRSDKVDFINFFSRENLLNFYEHGIYWFFTEYRRINRDGYVEWVAVAANLYQRTLDEDIQIRLRINNCDERHVWECYSSSTYIRRKETSLYPMQYMREMFDGLKQEANRETCAAVLIRVDGVEELHDGAPGRVRAARAYLANMLSYTLGTQCIATMTDEEHVLFFFPDICSASYMNKILEMAVHYSRLLLSDLMSAHDIHFCAAVSCVSLKDADLDDLLTVCMTQLAELGGEEEDKIVFCQNKETKREKASSAQADFVRKISVIGMPDETDSDTDKVIFTQCLSDMLLATSAEKGIQLLFQRLGEYYMADRVYILSMKETNRDLDVFCEWRQSHLETISIYLARTSMDKLRLLTRCSIEKKPLRYSAKPRLASNSKAGESEEWSYCIFPICISDSAYTVRDFLCIENPKRVTDGYHLINSLLPYIKNQKMKSSLYSDSLAVVHKNVLDGMPNLMEYVHTIPKILAHQYKSMGIYLAKVSRLSLLNSHHGFDYGRDMLRYIADTFVEVLGQQYLFRTWDNEFLALIPNISREVAEEKYKNMKVKFEGRYGEHIFLNHRWKEENFTSRELMDMPKTGIRGSIIDVEKYLKIQVSEPEESLEKLPEQCEFTVYVQPVFDVRTDKLAKAELLVRGTGQNGEIILPYRFLKRMEHEHTVRNVDLFVLEQALILLDKWKERGVEPIPLSINFSKDTILDNTILASFLAVRSRYPHLELNKIEIELPQNIGEEHYGNLATVMEQLREFGAVFALDNMGMDREDEKFLSQIRFDTVKIDQSLMADVTSSQSTRNTIRSIVDSCMEKKIHCVAEGVETKEQLEYIQKLGCGYAQGYYFDRPMPVEKFDEKYMNLSPLDEEACV